MARFGAFRLRSGARRPGPCRPPRPVSGGLPSAPPIPAPASVAGPGRAVPGATHARAATPSRPPRRLLRPAATGSITATGRTARLPTMRSRTRLQTRPREPPGRDDAHRLTRRRDSRDDRPRAAMSLATALARMRANTLAASSQRIPRERDASSRGRTRTLRAYVRPMRCRTRTYEKNLCPVARSIAVLFPVPRTTDGQAGRQRPRCTGSATQGRSDVCLTAKR